LLTQNRSRKIAYLKTDIFYSRWSKKSGYLKMNGMRPDKQSITQKKYIFKNGYLYSFDAEKMNI
jgi:hypothetical protein